MTREVQRAGGLAYREAGSSDQRVALLVHGWPESSYMWRHAMPALAGAGWRAVAPDLAGFGDSEPDLPGTWERHVEALERFARALELPRVALVMHDWGVMIGLRWACDRPAGVSALVISDGGFFSDRRWHDVANVLRTPGEGEQLLRSYSRDLVGSVFRGLSTGIGDDAVEEYWKGFTDDRRRAGHLDLYRSGDFEKLVPYEGCLAAFDLPALILWGGQDRFASPRMAQRFHSALAGSELRIFEEAGHFVWEDQPDATARALVDFLGRWVP
jgi:pimeloyl-ACP methyl ester carboxylesterase